MAEYLRAGATLLAETCPICHTPLLRLRSGEVICPIHGRVLLVRTDSEVQEVNLIEVLNRLESSIVGRLNYYAARISQGNDVELRDLIYWLDALERIEKIKAAIHSAVQQRSSQRQ